MPLKISGCPGMFQDETWKLKKIPKKSRVSEKIQKAQKMETKKISEKFLELEKFQKNKGYPKKLK